jgi:hypothetical protein
MLLPLERRQIESLLKIGRGSLHALERELPFATKRSVRRALERDIAAVTADVARLEAALRG